MSEGQPQAPDQAAPEQQIPVIDGNTEGVHFDIQASAEPTEGDDGRWDHQKAKTLATVVKEDGGPGNPPRVYERLGDDDLPTVDNAQTTYHSLLHDEIQNLRFLAEKDKSLKRGLEDAKSKSQPEREKDLQGVIEENEDQLRAAEQALEEARNKEIQKRNERIKKEVDHVLSPFEELYDANPDRFAGMPTSEFMAIGRELSEIDYFLEAEEENLDDIEAANKDIGGYIEEERELSSQWVKNHFDGLVDSVWDWGKGRGVEYKEFRDGEKEREFDPIYEGSFDKTPREKMDAIKAMSDRYIAKIREKRDATQTKRDELIAKYTSDADQEES